MDRRVPRERRLLSLLVISALALWGCGASAIDESELEASVASQLAAEFDQLEPNIDCPGDLEAEVGATTDCELSVDGDDAVYGVTVTVDELAEGRAEYTVQVSDEPIRGGDTEDDSPAEDDPASGVAE